MGHVWHMLIHPHGWWILTDVGIGVALFCLASALLGEDAAEDLLNALLWFIWWDD